MHKYYSAAVGIVITLAACEQPTKPGDAALSRIGTRAAISENGNVGTKGQGHAELPAGFGQSDFEFDAKEVGYGVTGAFRMFRLRNGLTSDFEGVVTCVSVDLENNRAWIGGVVTVNRSTDPNQQLAIHQPGQDVWFRVLDNGNLGEGDGSTPDRITVLGFKGAGVPPILTSAQYCQERPWLAGNANTFPLVDGDVKVRPN